ncbi:G-box-binding factor 4-like isoform X2 [Durio zibethinus]|uniref:G-box-binding factor 4-like isoform X2 n=1 Tax=Durio zibethinus TaxID=66656 RepID=A0A6P6B8N8_DURZI|nr:G-box-binding factor 4-like isoform X2 [Durio zibethinus]
MASSKVMPTSNSRNPDLSRRSTTSSSTKSQPFTDQNNNSLSSTMTVDGILRNVYSAAPTTETTLVDASITLMDTPIPTAVADNSEVSQDQTVADCNNNVAKSVDEVWREIVSGERKEITMKEEASDEMMTLEDFLAKASAVEEAAAGATAEVKVHPDRLSGGVYAFDPVGGSSFQILDKIEGSIVGLGNGMEVIGSGGGGGRAKRGREVLMEPLDKAAQQRQRRMIKNRESAARSRERKQAYQVELESLAVKLEEENEWLLKEKLVEKVVPVVEQRRPPRVLRRVRSLQW